MVIEYLIFKETSRVAVPFFMVLRGGAQELVHISGCPRWSQIFGGEATQSRCCISNSGPLEE